MYIILFLTIVIFFNFILHNFYLPLSKRDSFIMEAVQTFSYNKVKVPEN